MNQHDNILRRITARRVLSVLAVFLFILLICPLTAVQAAEQTVDVGIPVEEHPKLFIPRSMPTHGEGKIAVFLIQFPDYMNENPDATREYYDKLYFSGGADQYWNTTVSDFFYEQSYGKLQISGQVFDWYTAKHERSYYDNRKAELVVEAAAYYGAQGVDFSRFDGNQDGTIDGIVYHFAGEYGEEYDDPWYRGVCYSNPEAVGSIGGLAFKTMVQIYEGASALRTQIIQVCCHELMHTLGMPDLYGKIGMGLTNTNDLMSNNKATINPYLKMLLGWIENVRVFTSDANNIRLDVYDDIGDDGVAIIIDEYNGLFDEFYLVAYRDFKKGQRTPVIWHVDARLNPEKNAFLNENLYFNPRPDKDTAHGDFENPSPYLFIEELLADPNVDYVLNGLNLNFSPERIFGENSVLGPNSVPSSDMHDGDYTGILIENFLEHNGEYLTFDVSFVQDSDSPKIITKETELEFQQTIKIKFNEYVYKGKNWDGVRVTDMEGNPLEATIILPHYPRHEVEITFKDQRYEDGYIIVFPEDSLRDSSGNPLAATMLTVFKECYLPPVSQEQLPNPGSGYVRINSGAHFFPEEKSMVVITRLWENHVYDAKVEFMRLDYEGRVLNQTVVDNPFKSSRIDNVAMTGDGCYIFFCTAEESSSQRSDMLFCIDGNGNLKWTNVVFYNTGDCFYGYESCPYGNGILSRLVGDNRYDTVFISAKDGSVQISNIEMYRDLLPLSNGKLIRERFSSKSSSKSVIWELLNAETLESEAQLTFFVQDIHYDYTIHQAQVNEDGTILVQYRLKETEEVLLLDADFKIVKSIVLEKVDADKDLCWFENDGFCYIDKRGGGNHDNYLYHVCRYDKYLNLLWETDVEANFVYYFKSQTGDIMAYRSMYLPERECYIDCYESEEKYRIEHIHSLVYQAEFPSSCTIEGRAEFWYCTDCGVYFSDEGNMVVADLDTLALVVNNHTEEIIPAVPSTCTAYGYSEGKKCSDCGKILVSQTVIPKSAHAEEIIPAVPATCAEYGYSEGKRCSDCGKILISQTAIPKSAHAEEIIPAVPATCTAFGYSEGKKCSVCGEVLISQRMTRKSAHIEEIIPAVPATCVESGYSEGKKCSVCGEILEYPNDIPATGKHIYGEWAVTREATTKDEGEETRACQFCNEKETRMIPILPKSSATLVLITISAVLVFGSVTIVLIRKKR